MQVADHVRNLDASCLSRPFPVERSPHFRGGSMRDAVIRAILAACVIGPCAVHADDAGGCAAGGSRIEGPEPLTGRLLAAIPASAGVRFDPGTFVSEQIDYVGRVAGSSESWQLLYIVTTWGLSCRATARLLVFDAAGRYAGNYSGVARPDRIAGDRLVFPTGEEISLAETRLPGTMFVDGEVHVLNAP